MRKKKRNPPPQTGDLFRTDAALSQAMRDAEEILKWRVGPRVPGWRIARLAKALVDEQRR
jgi:hypothetical protein